jgi:ribosomal protein L16 Arg81 hydroxylase
MLISHLEPGDTVFIPGYWIHGAFNLDPCVGISRNFVPPTATHRAAHLKYCNEANPVYATHLQLGAGKGLLRKYRDCEA